MCLFESRPVLICLPRTGRAVRCVLERGEDMLITGARHPVLGKHKVLPLLRLCDVTDSQREAFEGSLSGTIDLTDGVLMSPGGLYERWEDNGC